MDFELSKSIEVSALLESVLHDMEPTSSDQDSNVSGVFAGGERRRGGGGRTNII